MSPVGRVNYTHYPADFRHVSVTTMNTTFFENTSVTGITAAHTVDLFVLLMRRGFPCVDSTHSAWPPWRQALPWQRPAAV
jgi:hypothetical protein